MEGGWKDEEDGDQRVPDQLGRLKRPVFAQEADESVPEAGRSRRYVQIATKLQASAVTGSPFRLDTQHAWLTRLLTSPPARRSGAAKVTLASSPRVSLTATAVWSTWSSLSPVPGGASAGPPRSCSPGRGPAWCSVLGQGESSPQPFPPSRLPAARRVPV